MAFCACRQPLLLTQSSLNLVKCRETPPWIGESQRYKPLQRAMLPVFSIHSRTLLWSLLEKGMPPCPMQSFNNHFCPSERPNKLTEHSSGMLYFHVMDTQSCQPHTSEDHKITGEVAPLSSQPKQQNFISQRVGGTSAQ